MRKGIETAESFPSGTEPSSLSVQSFDAPSGGRPDLLIIAGEHSGDEHAARLVAGLKARDPGRKVACLGGVHLQAAGAQLLYDLTAVSIVGFVEVVKHYKFLQGTLSPNARLDRALSAKGNLFC